MSWQINLSGHTDADVEEKVRDLARKFVAELKAADVGLTYAWMSGGASSGKLFDDDYLVNDEGESGAEKAPDEQVGDGDLGYGVGAVPPADESVESDNETVAENTVDE